MIGGTNVVAGGGGPADQYALQKSLMEFTSEKVIDWVFSCDPKIAGPAAAGNQVVALNVKSTPYQLLKFREFDHSVGMFLATCFNLSHLIWDAYDTIDSIRQDVSRMAEIDAGSASLKVIWALLDVGEFVIYDSGTFYNSAVVGSMLYSDEFGSYPEPGYISQTLQPDHIAIVSTLATSTYHIAHGLISFENQIDMSMFGTLEVDMSFSAYSTSQYAKFGVGDTNNDEAFAKSIKINNSARAIRVCDLTDILGEKYVKVEHYDQYDKAATTRIYKITLKL